MTALIAAALCYGLFVLSDLLKGGKKAYASLAVLVLGCIIMVTVTAAALYRGFKSGASSLSPFSLCLFVLALWLEVFTLFFALPAADTYTRVQEKPAVVDFGMYALCRHPGVLWLALCYIALYLLVPGSAVLMLGIAMTVGDVFYVLWQDVVFFPKHLEGYAKYKTTVPFLIPTWYSIKKCLLYYFKGDKHEI